jgi:flagellar hook-length control protein FliK
MTGTSVKDVGSALMNLPVSQSGKSQGTGDFQKIWSAQMSKGTADGSFQNSTLQENPSGSVVRESGSDRAAEDSQSQAVQSSNGKETENTQPEDTGVRETVTDESGETESVSEGTPKQGTGGTEEVSVDAQEEAMEVLNTAAWNLLQQIAEVFGIEPEELQAVMEDLGLGQLDLLDASKLGKLLLSLGGAEDSYALLMDEGLYDRYQALMAQRTEMVQESAETLDADPEELLTLIKEAAEEKTEESVPVIVEKNDGSRENQTAEEEPVLPAERTAGDGVEEAQQTGRQTQGQTDREETHSESHRDKGEPMNLFTQNLKETQFQPQLQQAEEVPQSTSWSSNTRQIMDQIMDYMKLQLNADTTNLEMQLHPESLGTLQVQLVSKGGMVTANFIAQNEAVKEALESQVVQLREQFEEQGVKVESIEVTVQTHEFERNLEQGRGREPQENAKRGRSRRVRLSGTDAPDADGQDGPADDLVAVGGSTVSYSA